MAQEERSREMPHSVILEGREKLTISGVTDVHSFDEEQVLLETVRGMLVVRGQGLHVERLQLEAGELIIQGEIGLLEYDDSVRFLKRISIRAPARGATLIDLIL